MGRLTDDMAQLRGNIDRSRESRLAQRNELVFNVNAQIAGFAATRTRNGARDAHARVTFVTDNANNVNHLLNDFRHTRQVMGRQGRKDRAAFVTDVSKKTLDLLNGFNAERKSMAERSAKERSDFITDMTNSVAAFINDATQDRAGAHAVFFGTATSKKKNSIPRIAIHLIDETSAGSVEGTLSQHDAHRSEHVQAEVVQTAAPMTPQSEVYTQAETASEHTEVNETKKPKRKPGEHFGTKKGR